MTRGFTDGERLMVEHARVARMATLGPDSAPHLVAVCPALLDGRVVIALEGGSRKHANVEADPRMALLFDDYVEDWNALRGVLIRGDAVKLEGSDRQRGIDTIYAKFQQYEALAKLDDGDPVIAIEITSIASWGLDE